MGANRTAFEDPRQSVSLAVSPGVAATTSLDNYPAASAAGFFGGELIAFVVLPWPAAILSPNGRAHWARKAAAIKAARAAAKAACEAALRRFVKADESVLVNVYHTPPKGRRADKDNCVARFKAGSDGIADAIGVDDALWRREDEMLRPDGSGRVAVRIYAIPA